LEDPTRNVAFLALEQEPKEPNQYVIFSRLGNVESILPSSVYAHQFVLFGYSKNRTFKLIGYCAPHDGAIDIIVDNHLLAEEISGNMFVCEVDQRGAPTDFPQTVVKSTIPIDISRLIVSYFPVAPVKRSIQINYGKGFYGLEEKATEKLTWSWAFGDAEILLFSYFDSPEVQSLQFGVSSFTQRAVSIEIGETRRFLSFDGSGTQIVILDVNLLPGPNILRITTDQPPQLPGNGDSRPMAFGIHNFTVIEKGD
jgi:hypothetical protein